VGVVLVRAIDVLLTAPVVIFFLSYVGFAAAFGRRLGRARRNVMVSVTADSIAETRRLNTPGALERFYGRAPFEATYVLHVGNERPGVARLAPGVIGVEVREPFLQWFRGLRLLTRVLTEIVGTVAAIRLMRRTGGNVLEVMSPSAMVPRALLVKVLSRCRLTTQVRGNLDLLTYSLGRYFYCRIPVGWAPLRLAARCVHHAVAEGFYRRCDLVVGYNVNNLQSAISNGADPQRSRLARIAVEQAIEDAPLVPRPALEGFPKEGRVILLWSRIGTEKYVREALYAFLELAATHADVHLVVVGDGPLRAELTAHAARAAGGDRAHFIGFRDRGYIRSAAQASDVALVPYGGSSLLEAALLQLPIVAFDIEWHGELVRPGETGFLADFADTHHLARQLTTALDRPDDARRMAAACRTLALQMFDPKRVRAEERRHYAMLLERPGG
jgi:glycosyltransferase involved in cell wall biosynthesis